MANIFGKAAIACAVAGVAAFSALPSVAQVIVVDPYGGPYGYAAPYGYASSPKMQVSGQERPSATSSHPSVTRGSATRRSSFVFRLAYS